MQFIQPKPYLDRLRLRNHAQGVERRRNMSKLILENGTPLPKPIEYEDIDKAFFDWVDKKLDVVYDGKKLPTYKLFSNQKISEYSQTWSNLDDTGNIIMNFKTITRENNPQFGENQGGNYNVPGKRDYPMFCVPVLQENGEEAYDLYTMKQPLSVNFMYTVSIICNKYELLNKFNELIQYEFSALECYISPNDHPMPMVIESINDESEYSIDDRKYYAQTYNIKLMGYIIRKEDFNVTKIPSRFKITLNTDDKSKKYKKVAKDDNWLGELENQTTINKEVEPYATIDDTALEKIEVPGVFNVCDTPMEMLDTETRKKPFVKIEEAMPEPCEIETIHKIYYTIIAEFPYCEERSVTFTMDCDVDVDGLELKNIYDFVFKINGVKEDFEDTVILKTGDKIELKISKKDEYGDSTFIITGKSPENVDVTERKEIHVN